MCSGEPEILEKYTNVTAVLKLKNTWVLRQDISKFLYLQNENTDILHRYGDKMQKSVETSWSITLEMVILRI